MAAAAAAEPAGNAGRNADDVYKDNVLMGIETVQACSDVLIDAVARGLPARGARAAAVQPMAAVDVRASLADAAKALCSEYGPTDAAIVEETDAQLAQAAGVRPRRAQASSFVRDLMRPLPCHALL